MQNSATVTLIGCLLEDEGINRTTLHLKDRNCTGVWDEMDHVVTFSFNGTNTCGTEVEVGALCHFPVDWWHSNDEPQPGVSHVVFLGRETDDTERLKLHLLIYLLPVYTLGRHRRAERVLSTSAFR